MSNSYKNYIDLRAKIQDKLDPKLFKRDPIVGIITVGMFVLYWGLFALGVKYPLMILPIGILLGFIAEFLSMANHDILHGSVFKNKTFSLLFCIPNSCITLISPSFWKFWHNLHHQSVDRWTAEKRPYEMGYETYGYPTLRKLVGPFELFFYKIIHLTRTQFKFITDKRYTSERHLSLKKAVTIQFMIIVAFKIFLFVKLPFVFWLGLELLPILIQGFLSSIFLVTQHSHKLEMKGSIPTYSVFMGKWIDLWFLNVGYHVEHHLFPHLPSRHLPLIRQELLQREYSPVPGYSMTEALKKIYAD